jgi:hypothetical protein
MAVAVILRAARTRSVAFLCASVLLGHVASFAQSTPSSNQKSYMVELPAAQQWFDTGIDLRGGAKLRFTAEGQMTYPSDESFESKTRTEGRFGPEGLPRGFADLLHGYGVASAGHGAIIGRVGSSEYAQAFLIGAGREYEAPVGGRLFLGINQSEKDAETATGSFEVTVEVLKEGNADAAEIGGPAETRIPGITKDLLSKIPRRVSDSSHNPGDMVNVLIVGTQDQVIQAFTAAGWVQVDTTLQSTVINAIFRSLDKKEYLTMPMSTLYLFNRPQDYGFAHAEPVRVAMSRNHLRIWKSPYEVDGRPLWCVAATHDIGFERDQRNDGVTHKIDSAIDGEREFVNGTLSGTGLVARRDHVTTPDPLTSAKTATGGEFHSDGRVLVLVLKNTSH